MTRTYDIFGVPVHAVDLPGAVGVIHGLGTMDTPPGGAAYVCVRDINGVVECQRNPILRAVHRRAAMVTPDACR